MVLSTRTCIPVLIAAVLLTVGLAAPAQAGPAGRYSATAHEATNKARAKNGLKPLATSKCLKKYAAREAAAIAVSQTLVHQDLGPVLAGCGLTSAGENLAAGFSTGKNTVSAWMNSEGHRANILTAGFRFEAIAAVKGADGQWYVSQVFGGK